MKKIPKVPSSEIHKLLIVKRHLIRLLDGSVTLSQPICTWIYILQIKCACLENSCLIFFTFNIYTLHIKQSLKTKIYDKCQDM